MPRHLMIAVDWFGPYNSLEEARDAASEWDWSGLYVCVGKLAKQQKPAMQYVGISNQLSGRLSKRHHKLGLDADAADPMRDPKIWLGEVVTAEPSGKKVKVTKATLDYAEWLHARFLRLPLNDRKTKTLPSRTVTVMNRWWKTDFKTPRRNRPNAGWPDLIDFQGIDLPARTVWFGGRQRTFSAPDFDRPD